MQGTQQVVETLDADYESRVDDYDATAADGNGHHEPIPAAEDVNRSDDAENGHERRPKAGSTNGIIDLLNKQINRYSSAAEHQRTQLQLATQKKPMTKASSSTFRSVFDELHVETVANKVLSVPNGASSDGVQADVKGCIDVDYLHGSDDRRAANVTRSLSTAGVKMTGASTWPDGDEAGNGQQTQQKSRSSAACRRALYEKYLERREVWTEGLSPAGKQTLLELQRRKGGRYPLRAQTAPASSHRSTASTSWSLRRPTTSARVSASSSAKAEPSANSAAFK